MGRNKDSLIELAAKLTGENCGEVKTKKDALKKIACFYAGQEVECNTVADALQCIASHCNGGGGGGDENAITIPDVLQNIKVETLKIASEVGGNARTSLMLNTVNDYYVLIKAPNKTVLLDNLKYSGGHATEIIPETTVTGSGGYSYKVEYTVISDKQVSIDVITTAYSYNAGSVNICYCKKDLSN